jgi:hypothetical protein
VVCPVPDVLAVDNPNHTNFTSLLPVPDMLEGMGYKVFVTDLWQEGQCRWDGKAWNHYLWTTPDGQAGHHLGPSAYMVHHTAGTTVIAPDPNRSKAQAWAGLWDPNDGRLYHVQNAAKTRKPAVIFSSAGPARVSSGYGDYPMAWEYAFKEIRTPQRAKGPDDDTALNRYAFNIEVCHPGDGGYLDTGVWNLVVDLGVILHAFYGWSERTLGHKSWTLRKIDPRWKVKGVHEDPDDAVIEVQKAIASRLKDFNPPKPPVDPPEEEMEDQGRNMLFVKEGMSGQHVEYIQNKIIQIVEGVLDEGRSTRAFFDAHAPTDEYGLVWKEWNSEMTRYFSDYTNRNSYGVGASEQAIIDRDWTRLLMENTT